MEVFKSKEDLFELGPEINRELVGLFKDDVDVATFYMYTAD